MLTSGGSERMNIALNAGWNWVSSNLDLSATKGDLASCMTAAQPWTEGDIIKNPKSRQFSVYSAEDDAFVGTLEGLHFSQIYMVYAANGNTMYVSGNTLPEDSMVISVRGDGQWTPMPCLLDRRTSVTEAFADYFQKAGPSIASQTAMLPPALCLPLLTPALRTTTLLTPARRSSTPLPPPT